MKYSVYYVIIKDNIEDTKTFWYSEHKDLKTAYDMVTMLSDYKKDIRDVIADIDENDESMVGNIVDFKDGHMKLTMFVIKEDKE